MPSGRLPAGDCHGSWQSRGRMPAAWFTQRRRHGLGPNRLGSQKTKQRNVAVIAARCRLFNGGIPDLCRFGHASGGHSQWIATLSGWGSSAALCRSRRRPAPAPTGLLMATRPAALLRSFGERAMLSERADEDICRRLAGWRGDLRGPGTAAIPCSPRNCPAGRAVRCRPPAPPRCRRHTSCAAPGWGFPASRGRSANPAAMDLAGRRPCPGAVTSARLVPSLFLKVLSNKRRRAAGAGGPSRGERFPRLPVGHGAVKVADPRRPGL